MTATVATGTAAGTYPLSVLGTAASGSHTVAYTLTVTSTSGGCTAAQLLGNAGFENGATIAPWTQSSTLGFAPINNDTADEPAHSGSWDAWTNGDGKADTDTVAQTVTIPAACTATLSYWLHVDTTENTTTATPDTFKVQLLDQWHRPDDAGDVLQPQSQHRLHAALPRRDGVRGADSHRAVHRHRDRRQRRYDVLRPGRHRAPDPLNTA